MQAHDGRRPCTSSLVLIPAGIPTTSALAGKKREEAKATETRAYQKILEAKFLECQPWLDIAVFVWVDTRTIKVGHWVTGRWVEDEGSPSPPKTPRQAEGRTADRTACCVKAWI